MRVHHDVHLVADRSANRVDLFDGAVDAASLHAGDSAVLKFERTVCCGGVGVGADLFADTSAEQVPYRCVQCLAL